MQIQCTQCGSNVNLEASAKFLSCPFCNSALYVDRSKVVFHFVVSPTISQEEAAGKLRRWMAGNETVKDLDVHATITHQELLYFPMWRFLAEMGREEKEYSEPASSFSIADIKTIPLSGGSLQFSSPKDFSGIPLTEPDVLLDSAIHWLNQEGVPPELIKETNLIHIPFYLYKYQFDGKFYQAVVDASSGRVLASVYPAKDELPFTGMALAAAIAFFFLGLVCPNHLIRLIVYGIVSVPFGIIAYSIVKKY